MQFLQVVKFINYTGFFYHFLKPWTTKKLRISTSFQGYLTFLYEQNLDKKSRITTLHLLQCKTNFLIHLCFWGRNLCQIIEYPSWDKIFFLIRLHSPTFVYNRLNSSWLVYVCLDSPTTRLHSSTFF